MTNYVIIGNGITGITAARCIRKNDPSGLITVISGESDYFYSRTALMYVFMKRLNRKDTEPYERRFYPQNRIDLIRNTVTSLDTSAKQLTLFSGPSIAFDKLLIATGSQPNKISLPGSDLPGVVSFYGLSDLQDMEKAAKNARSALVVGGGLIGIEMVEMLVHRGIQVTYLLREPVYFPQALSAQESEIALATMRAHGVTIIAGDELDRIEKSDNWIRTCVTKKGTVVACDMVGIAIGVSPNVSFLAHSAIATKRGILVNPSLQTNVPDIFAAGDCAELSWKPIDKSGRLEQLWYTGKMQGEIAGCNMAGQSRVYDRGVKFNSAQFMDINYHTFGEVNGRLPGESDLFFRIPNQLKSLRLVLKDNRVIGINVLGLRFRDAVCRQWIRDGLSPDTVLAQLKDAWFEPEFTPYCLKEVSHA